MTQEEMFATTDLAPAPPPAAHLGHRDKRPDTSDDGARRTAAATVAIRHASLFELKTDEDKAAFVVDLVRATRGNDDGYEIAKTLEQQSGHQGSSEVVEALDEYLHELHEVTARHEREWVAHFQIEATLMVGTEIGFRWGWESKKGRISKIDATAAKYLVESEGIQGLAVIAYERATPS